ncbi:MAG: hypothetical protein Kow0073_03240 [Immundisolibacter sp.]
MFCGLNGATRTPRRCSQRHSPVTSALLPASEVVPWIIKVLAGMGKRERRREGVHIIAAVRPPVPGKMAA